MSVLDPTDTIAAVSSPPGPGLRGLVRLTGPDAGPIALAGFTPDHAGAWPQRTPLRREGVLRVDGLRPPLPAAVVFWPGPKTYTGQPLAEIHTVGSPPLLQLVLAHCLTRGARLAEPGEFTLRAFLSGRIDLTRAEAVLGVIDARTPAQLDAALDQLAGGLAGPIEALRDQLLDVLAHLEANLDFADEPDVNPLGRLALAADLSAASDRVAALAQRLHGRDRPDGHPRVVLVGAPNAGKSRLFNALVGQTRALVSPQAGTTRDYLTGLCDCAGLTVALIDTAGIEPAADRITHQAQAFRADQAATADLLLTCESADAPAAPVTSPIPQLAVWTKQDLVPRPAGSPALPTSAATGAGLADLRSALADALRRQESDHNLPASTGARCRNSLIQASQALQAAADTLGLAGGDELVAIDLRQAIDELGKVVGAVVTEDVLDRIFRRFCIGK